MKKHEKTRQKILQKIEQLCLNSCLNNIITYSATWPKITGFMQNKNKHFRFCWWIKIFGACQISILYICSKTSLVLDNSFIKILKIIANQNCEFSNLKVAWLQQNLTLFKCQPTKWSKELKTVCRLLPKNCLSMFDHFGGGGT